MVSVQLLVAALRVALAHPLHTTLTEVSVDAAHHTVRATVRLFADDLAYAIQKHGDGNTASTEMAAAAFVASSFALTNAGHSLTLESCGTTRRGDLVFVCLQASPREPVTNLSARNTMFCGVYADQVNLVQVTEPTSGGSRRTVAFVPGDGPKRLQ